MSILSGIARSGLLQAGAGLVGGLLNRFKGASGWMGSIGRFVSPLLQAMGNSAMEGGLDHLESKATTALGNLMNGFDDKKKFANQMKTVGGISRPNSKQIKVTPNGNVGEAYKKSQTPRVETAGQYEGIAGSKQNQQTTQNNQQSSMQY